MNVRGGINFSIDMNNVVALKAAHHNGMVLILMYSKILTVLIHQPHLTICDFIILIASNVAVWFDFLKEMEPELLSLYRLSCCSLPLMSLMPSCELQTLWLIAVASLTWIVLFFVSKVSPDWKPQPTVLAGTPLLISCCVGGLTPAEASFFFHRKVLSHIVWARGRRFTNRIRNVR